MSSKIAKSVLTKVAGKQAKQYEAQDPLYENYVTDQGKTKRRKRAIPEGLTEHDQRILIKVRKRAHYLDKGFTICGFRFGWTFFIALIPVLGDVIDALLGYNLVIKQAKKCDLPAMLVSRMQLNTLLATAIGMVPIAGDIIMAAFKPNSRNAILFEEFLIERAKNSPVGGQGIVPGTEDAHAQRVISRSNEGNWSSRTGQNAAMQAGSSSGPTVPVRAAGTSGRVQPPAVPPRI